MKVIFITRKYPPSVGGMQKLSHNVIHNFPELKNAEVISWGRSQKGLIFFIPWAFLKSLYLLISKKIDLIQFDDAALSFMGYILKKMFKVPIVIRVHGLDLTYKNKLYQFMLNKTLKEFDKIICISEAAKNIVINKGIEKSKCCIIHCGVDVSKWRLFNNRNSLINKLEKELEVDLSDKFLLLSVGRLVERKGVHWFIKNVFRKLDKHCMFLIASSGEEERKIKELIESLNLEDKILMLGKVSDETLKLLYNSADAFIMPNIPIKGDIEGFGIVAIEAASCGLPVIASDLEGVKDAIKEGENGFLVEPLNAKDYIKKINDLMNMKNVSDFSKKQIEYTHKNYDLKNISQEYYELFKEILKK
ncbi:MAG: glycosyltransferase family 4 protein [Nanoarchaeota archaeon]|nr:glycosyltransferase family 4 protein [Nanoarchaeota archaeon]